MAVTKCMHCGVPVEARDKFCPECKLWLEHLEPEEQAIYKPVRIWGTASPEYESGDRFLCPECGHNYSGLYLRRHLVDKHGWKGYDNENVYKPALEGDSKS